MVKLREHFVALLFLSVLSASLAGNVYLGSLIRSDRASTQRVNSEAAIHRQIDSFSVAEIDGRELKLSLKNSKPTVLYIYSPSCPWCAKNLSNIRSLSIEEKERYRFIGLSIGHGDLEAYLAKNPLPFSSYESLSDGDLRLIDFRGAPQTILLDASGMIKHNWRGAYINSAEDPVRKYFALEHARANTAGTSRLAPTTAVE